MRIDSDLCGWILVEARLGGRGGHDLACLRVQGHSPSDEVREIHLPILPNGRIQELIRLPDEATSLVWQFPAVEKAQGSSVHIRRVDWFARTCHMVKRVIGTFSRLTKSQRKIAGLSFWKVISDLSGAYRIVTELRERLPYFDWIERCDRIDDTDKQRIRQHVAHFADPPHFHLLLVVGGAERAAIQATLDSLKQQLFRNFTCAVLDVGGKCDPAFCPDLELKDVGLDSCIVAQPHVAAWLDQLNGALAGPREWVMLLRPGDVLPVHSIYWFACESLAQPKVAVLYSDDDVLDAKGQRCQPRFKPDWSLTHLRATNFVGDAVALRGNEVAKAGGVDLACCLHGTYDLLLRVIDVVGEAGAGKVAHLPVVLRHRMDLALPLSGFDETADEAVNYSRVESGLGQESWNDPLWCMGVLRAHLARNGVIGEVSETLPGCWRVRYRVPDVPPLVSVIIPTRDVVELIRQCLASLLEKTTYPRFEILVVDNQSAAPDALAYLEQIATHERVKVLRYDMPFNYSAMNNMAVREACGEIVCLLNNDTEVISPDWLDEMVGHLMQPKVGVVGAKLYFPNERVQHGGDLVGVGGVANHAHAFLRRDDPGYCNRAMVAQELSAVTAACMITWRDLYQQLDGLDEKHLRVAFNDVDYCLRVREAGYRVVWTPHAELYHYESLSRGKDQSPEKARRAKHEAAYMRKRWKRVLRRDPFYNPNLSYERPDFSLNNVPMTEKPWQI